ncbi:MAG: DMT family transporter [Pseudonocardiaceae bacterium]
MSLSPARGATLVVLAAVLFGTTGTAQALGPGDLDPLAVGAGRVVLGGTILAILAATRGAYRGRFGTPWVTVLCGGIGVATYQLGFFSGVHLAGVAVGTVIALGSCPLFAGLFEWLVTGHRPRPAWLAATCVAVVGVTVLVLSGRSDTGGTNPALGALPALLAGLGYGIYTVCGSRLIARGARADGAMGLLFGVGAVILLPVLLMRWPGGVDGAAGMAVVTYLALVPTVLAYLLFGSGLRVLRAGTVATLNLAEPVVAALLGIGILGESISVLGSSGILIVVMGLALLALPSRRSSNPNPLNGQNNRGNKACRLRRTAP